MPIRPLTGLALALVGGALTLRLLALEPVRVISESMLPTLHSGDHVFVNKLALGARLPFLGARLPALREPRRGELVVFERAGAGGARERLVKRVIALPGERVAQREGRLWVAGAPVDQWPTETLRVDAQGHPLRGARERLGDADHAWVDDPDCARRDFDLVVPADRYFVLGDNRDHSQDSRDFGPIARDQLVGVVMPLRWSLALGSRASAP